MEELKKNLEKLQIKKACQQREKVLMGELNADRFSEEKQREIEKREQQNQLARLFLIQQQNRGDLGEKERKMLEDKLKELVQEVAQYQNRNTAISSKIE